MTGEGDAGQTRVAIDRVVLEVLENKRCPDKDACLLALAKHKAQLEQAAGHAIDRHGSGSVRVELDDVLR